MIPAFAIECESRFQVCEKAVCRCVIDGTVPALPPESPMRLRLYAPVLSSQSVFMLAIDAMRCDAMRYDAMRVVTRSKSESGEKGEEDVEEQTRIERPTELTEA